MRQRTRILGLSAAALITVAAGDSSALSMRVQVVQPGDFILIGNALAQDCGPGTPAPKAGTPTCSMAGDLNDGSPDIFWRAENGIALANNTIGPDQAQTVAKLELPVGATVTHAYLYWSADSFNGPDNTAVLQCTDGAAATSNVQAMNTLAGNSNTYHAAADVTDYVKANGSCAYLVGGVDAFDYKSASQARPNGYAVWWMAVLYKLDGAPHKQLTLFDGLDDIGNGNHSPVTVNNLLVPKSFSLYSKASLGVVGYDGDEGIVGDQFLVSKVPFNAGREYCSMNDPQCTALKDCSGVDNDFFNSTRSNLGTPLSVIGDLPQLTGGTGSMNRIDIDVVDISFTLWGGETTLSLDATSVEPVSLSGVITSIPAHTDADMDALADDEETYFGTDPNDSDSDNDGVSDGDEGCHVANCQDPEWNIDSDDDGLINASDPDSDDDGLYDGTELGLDCDDPATKTPPGSTIHCIADADTKTTTDPLEADTDDGGILDGSEDFNRNGKADAGETDPVAGHGADDFTGSDADGDGLSDNLEDEIGSDPNDRDSDDDGLVDALEPNPADDTDGDGLPNIIDPDSDNDGLFDGTESGLDCSSTWTDASLGHCIPDADPATTTSPVDADTDDGGVSDGAEDANLDGKVDPGEFDPKIHGDDDKMSKDSDDDGLSNDLEITLGSDPMDKDSDDDGVPDGNEANPSNDEDGDGLNNVLDPDSDNDGLFDGTEGGYDCNGPGTNKMSGNCIPDGDKGMTTTSMVDKDSDNGGINDGDEDFDKDGVYDPNTGEANPSFKDDDINLIICDEDAQCGTPNDGVVCNTETRYCVPGCRGGSDPQGCPDDGTCELKYDIIGTCIPAQISSSSTGGEGTKYYDGCVCGVGSDRGSSVGWAVLAAGCVSAIWRRRRRAMMDRAAPPSPDR